MDNSPPAWVAVPAQNVAAIRRGQAGFDRPPHGGSTSERCNASARTAVAVHAHAHKSPRSSDSGRYRRSRYTTSVREADWIIGLGPGAGHDGGRIVFEGTPADLVAARSTLTSQHLAAYVGSRPEAVASR